MIAPAAVRHLGLLPVVVLVVVLASCGGGGGDDSSPAPATSLPALRASADTLVAAGCTGGSASGTLYANAEVEPFAAANPRDGNHLLGAWQQDRWSDGGARAVASAVSFDGGRSWARTLHPMSRCGGAAVGAAGDFERASDPWIDIAADGSVYMMALALSGGVLQPGSRNAMLVSRSLDGGRSFAAPVVLAESGAEGFNDKNTLSADTQDPRFVYAVWDRIDTAGRGPTLLARSSDAGTTWEPARIIYAPSPAGGVAQTIGNRIVVLPAGPQRGTLVNAFVQIDTVAGISTRTVRVIRSADQGLTWGPAIMVAEHRAVGASDPATGAAIRDGAIIPALAVAPDGTLWLAWQDARFSGGQRDAIAVVRSLDGGLTWSPPQPANRDLSVAAFTPTLHVRGDGLLGLLHYDLRPNTADTSTLLAAVWLLSTRDGSAWAEAPVWAGFDIAQAPQANGLFLGDYQGLVSAGSDFLPLLALSSTDLNNRTDIYPLRITPAVGGAARSSVRSAAAAGARAQALRGALSEAEFARRRHALTVRAMEQRLPGWAARVGARSEP